MAILTAEVYEELTAQSFTGDNRQSIVGWCAAVSNAILRAIAPFYPEPITVTDAILDGPASRDLLLPIIPARSITSVYVNPSGYGLLANFTADHLLDNTGNEEYQLLIDDKIRNYSRSGILRRVKNVWGASYVTAPTRLAPVLEPSRGNVKVSYLAGPATVPPEIEAAAVMAVSILYNRKETGLVASSESWNGYSRGLAGPGLETSVLSNPDIQALLADYLPGLRIGRR